MTGRAAQSGDAGATDPTPTQLAQERASNRRARRAKLQKLRRAKEKVRSTPKDRRARAEAALGVSREPTGDPEIDARDAFIREQLEAPLTSPEDLAHVLGRLQMGLYGLAKGSRWATPAMALQWTDGQDPTPHCLSGCRFLWPWLDGRGLVVKLAEQGDVILAAIGALILVGPAIRPAIEAWRGPPKLRPVPPAPADRGDDVEQGNQVGQPRATA